MSPPSNELHFEFRMNILQAIPSLCVRVSNVVEFLTKLDKPFTTDTKRAQKVAKNRTEIPPLRPTFFKINSAKWPKIVAEIDFQIC